MVEDRVKLLKVCRQHQKVERCSEVHRQHDFLEGSDENHQLILNELTKVVNLVLDERVGLFIIQEDVLESLNYLLVKRNDEEFGALISIVQLNRYLLANFLLDFTQVSLGAIDPVAVYQVHGELSLVLLVISYYWLK